MLSVNVTQCRNPFTRENCVVAGKLSTHTMVKLQILVQDSLQPSFGCLSVILPFKFWYRRRSSFQFGQGQSHQSNSGTGYRKWSNFKLQYRIAVLADCMVEDTAIQILHQNLTGSIFNKAVGRKRTASYPVLEFEASPFPVPELIGLALFSTIESEGRGGLDPVYQNLKPDLLLYQNLNDWHYL